MMLRYALAVSVMAGAASAQTAEIFIPNKDETATMVKPEVVPTNRLAACLANPNAATCTGVSADAGGVQFESATGAPTVTYETLVLDLGSDGHDSGGDDYAVTVKPEPPAKPVDYSEPVKTYDDVAQKPHKIELPSVAVTIEFDYNSSAIRYDQFGKLDGLVAAFNDPALAGYSYAVIGHTDASGSDYYNCDLSYRRASEVMGALRSKYVTLQLYPVGFGEHVLKNAYDPRAPENRRVTFLRLPDDYSPVLKTASDVCGIY